MRPRRIASALSVGCLLAMVAGPMPQALAKERRGTAALACGTLITHTTVLRADVGPCSGNGLVVAADHVVLDLNGHTVTGSHATATPSETEQVGVLLEHVHASRVINGTVRYFDAGVAVNGGSDNSVERIRATDNVNVNNLTNVTTTCNYGDGITVTDSNDNRIAGNVAANNGPFSGISLVGSSNGNEVRSNVSAHNDIPFQHPNNQIQNHCEGTEARLVQDIGIRVEGPGATHNVVAGNYVTDNALYGISIHGNICLPNAAIAGAPNTANLIENNFVSYTGLHTHSIDSTSSGIGILRQGPLTVVCPSYGNSIIDNTSVHNFEDGLFVGSPTHGNTISGNTFNNNAFDGIQLNAAPGAMCAQSGGPPVTCTGAVDNVLVGNKGSGNGNFDGVDLNPGCDHNLWVANMFVTINQPCVASNGGTGTGPAAPVVTSVSPTSGPQGTSVTIGGSNLAAVTAVDFGAGNEANAFSCSATSCTATAPPGTGTVDVTVVTPAVSSATSPADQFTYTGPFPSITSVTTSGTISNPTITVTGANLGAAPAPNPSTPPEGQHGCPTVLPTSGNGYLYGNSLWFSDSSPTGGWTAGQNADGNFDCLGLIIVSYTSTQVVFHLDNGYDNTSNGPANFYVLANGDPITVSVAGATMTGTVGGLT